jgi:hypothetical protein
MTEAIEIKLSDIALRDDLSPRDGIDYDAVREYTVNIASLPPVLVAMDKAKTPTEALTENEDFKVYVLIDGWHRFYAHRNAEHKTILAIVDAELEPKDFFFRAICANKVHGIRFTAGEKIRISKYLFIAEHRTAAEISQAIGCSVRHATDLIKDLAHEKKQRAIELAKDAADRGFSERQIAEYLQNLGYKASKSGVNRWLQPEPVPTYMVKDKDAIQVSPQIGESPKRDTEQLVNAGGQPIDEEGRILNVSGEIATVAPRLVATPEQFKDSKESTTKTRVGVCPSCEIRTVRVPNLDFGVAAACTKIFFYCDRCKEYIEIRLLLPKKE